MLYSMTGFGRAVVETSDMKITVEAKSLNSKQMDLTVRVPQTLRASEPEMRSMASKLLERGKADVCVYVENLGTEATARLNIPVLKACKQEIEKMAAELSLPEPADWYSVLMRFPDVMHVESSESADNEDQAAAMKACQQALDELMAHRRTEGIKLEEFFTVRIDRIAELLAQVPQYEKERIERIRARIVDSLDKLTGYDVDQGRLEQEMIYYIEKLDINEEKQRLTQHLAYFKETMHADEKGLGKKLGFISQEMGREINTLGSKSNHAEMQKLVVKMKDELEQIKEQVLNVM